MGSGSGSGSGATISATDFNNAIDDKDAQGGEKLYYAEAENTKHTDYQHTISANGSGVSKEDVKKGIRAGVSGKHASQVSDPNVKVSEGYYKYITLTDKDSKNEYSYEFYKVNGNELQYRLIPNMSDDTIDNVTGGSNGWTLTSQQPIVTITIEDGVIHLKSNGDEYSARKE